MADDFARATSAPRPVTLNGKEYLVHKIRPRDLGEIEAWMKSVTEDPRVGARRHLEGLPDAVAKHVWDTAVAEAKESWPPSIDGPTGQRLLATPEGEARLIHILLRRGVAGFTIEQARDLSEVLSAEEVSQLMALASMGDPGDPKSATEAAATAPADPSATKNSEQP